MGIIERTQSLQPEWCDNCGATIPPETEYAIWGDAESGLELLLCLKCAEARQRKKREGKNNGDTP
ncbi:MAG: hypothetical protein PCFJNLEI_03657 [Verrucomicrobiae bacterium]|nr:hypothetical protein [Verrucomicrobiae bacterium]